MTAEDVKRVVREYAGEQFPEWRCAVVSISIGVVGDDDQSEILLIKPKDAPRPQGDQERD
jgi:hypothetical protein